MFFLSQCHINHNARIGHRITASACNMCWNRDWRTVGIDETLSSRESPGHFMTSKTKKATLPRHCSGWISGWLILCSGKPSTYQVLYTGGLVSGIILPKPVHRFVPSVPSNKNLLTDETSNASESGRWLYVEVIDAGNRSVGDCDAI